MSLEQQILIALRRAIREERLDVADHLWQAAEALVKESEHEAAGATRLTIDDIGMVVADALLRPRSDRSVHAESLPQRLGRKH